MFYHELRYKPFEVILANIDGNTPILADSRWKEKKIIPNETGD